MNPNRANSGPKPNQQTQLTMRLTPEAYRQVAARCLPLLVGTQTTELQAAFVLGQQSVLQILRDEIVVG